MMLEKKLSNDKNLGVNVCNFTKNFASKYANQRFDKKTDRKRNELKSCKLLKGEESK